MCRKPSPLTRVAAAKCYCQAGEDVIGHFLKSRDTELTEAIGSELITASDEKLLAAIRGVSRSERPAAAGKLTS
jgi:hypothetical protein